MQKARLLREGIMKNGRCWCGCPAFVMLSLAFMCLYSTFDKSIFAGRARPVRPPMPQAAKPSVNKNGALTRPPPQSKQLDTPSSSARLQHLVQTCKRLRGVIPPPASAAVIPPNSIVEIDHAIVYCNIPKTGSTFWKRVLRSLSLASSTIKESKRVHDLPSFRRIRQRLGDKKMTQFLDSSTSFLFVREPYSRLLSGYVDKLYNPNDKFWGSIGRDVVRLVRKNATEASIMCGHDVTFSELVKSILIKKRTQMKINKHFTPMHMGCNPCQYQYDFIGKMETFQQDLEFLLNKWVNQYGVLNLQIGELTPNQTILSAKGHIDKMFRARKCIAATQYPVYNLLLRTWRHLQIRGIISKRVVMSVSPSNAGAIDQSTFENIVLTAITQSVNRTELKQQREEALIQAYQSVPLEDMEQLRRYVLRDCQYFGYDDRPEKLFQRSGQKSADRFNYFPGLTARLIHNSSL